MSYEGFTQIICENGHYYESEENEFMYGGSFRCSVCETEVIGWANEVDYTNGSYSIDDPNGQGKRIDGYIDPSTFEIEKEAEYEERLVKVCVRPTTYKIPKG